MKIRKRIIVLSIVMLFVSISTAFAATIAVTTTSDEQNTNGQCSLREALSNINNGNSIWTDCIPAGNYGASDTINIPAGTYTITIVGADEDANATGDYDISKSINIVGAGAGATTINGGGLDRVFHITGPSAVTISGVTITGGLAPGGAGGGIYNYSGTLNVTNSAVNNNSSIVGGGIYNGEYGASGTLTVTNSTISGNTTTGGGGGIQNSYGTLMIVNSTISGNTTDAYGGGINSYGTVAIASSTIAVNTSGTGGGIHNSGDTITLSNSIVANQIAGGDCSSNGGSYTSNGYNLESGSACGFTGTGDMQNTDPKLGPLKNNGGLTFTHALLDGSLAINSIPNGVNGCGTTITKDQRGISRPQPSGGLCDIGAFEVEQCIQQPSGLVSWWGGDNNTLDMVGGNNGSWNASGTYTAGKVGQSFSFNGVDQFVSVLDVDFRSNAARSMALWVQTTDAGDPIVFGANGPLKGAFFGRGNKTTQHLHLGIASGKATVEWYDSGHHSIQGTSNIADGIWHQLVFVSDGAETVSIYIDGVFETSGSFHHTSGSNSTRFGSQYEGNIVNYNYYYNGLLDEVEFFNSALSSSEISAIYNAGSAGICRSCSLPPAGLVAWWGGNGNALDMFGGNNGTLVNGATYASGKVSQAFSLDGVDDFVDAGTDDVFNFSNGTGDFSIDAWIRLNTYPSQAAGIVGKATHGPGSPFNFPYTGWGLLVQPSGALAFTGAGIWGLTTADGLVPTGDWTHVAVTRSGSTYKLYVNGAEGVSNNHVDALETSTTSLKIGTVYEDFSFLDGLIDEVKIFTRALSADEIAAIYNAGSAGQCLIPMIKHEPSNTFYHSFLDAFAGVQSSGDTLLVRQGSVTENVDYSKAGMLINMRGGCVLDFVPNPALYSTITGLLQISNGGISVENIIVK